MLAHSEAGAKAPLPAVEHKINIDPLTQRCDVLVAVLQDE